MTQINNWEKQFNKKFATKDGSGSNLIPSQAKPIIKFIEEIITLAKAEGYDEGYRQANIDKDEKN